MAKIRGYIAASVDGFIADRSGGVDWLQPFEQVDYGYEGFIGEIGTVVMGRKTYEQTRSFGPDWAYPGKRGVVVTSGHLGSPPPHVTPWDRSLPELVRYLRRLTDGDAWIVGGSQLQSGLLDLGAMERLELFLIPVLLGHGVPLFRTSEHTSRLSLASVEQLGAGMVRLDYRLA